MKDIANSLNNRMAEFDLQLSQMSAQEKIKSAVLGWGYLCKSQRDYDALCRLANRSDALSAWVKLYAKATNEKWSFYSVAEFIGRETVRCFLPASIKKTEKEIKQAGARASKLAAELADLIEQNWTLKIFDEQLVPSAEEAALSRLCRGVSSSSFVFSEEVEAHLDVLQARDYPEFKNMTTSQAYRQLSYGHYSHNGFVHRLRRFSDLAAESTSFRPLCSRPNAGLADEHVYSVDVCEILDMAYGSPCIEIAAALASAVFDKDIDADTVKKWWQRRPTDLDQGDVSDEIA